MEVAINRLPKNQAELTIEVSLEELRPFLEQATEEMSKELNIPGFRPGKAPYDVVEKQVGAMKIYQQAAEKAVQKTYPQVVIDNKLTTIGPPKISVEKVAPGNPLVYKATVALLPKVALGDYKKVKVAKKEIKVEQKEVEATVDNLRKMFGKEKRVLRSAKKGDKVEIDMDTFMDRVPIDGGQSKNHPITIGEGHFIPGFEEALLGLAEGQTKEFQLKFPKEYQRKDLAGKPVEFRVRVKGVHEIELPALDDNFAKMAGKFEKLGDLNKQIERNIHEEKGIKEKQRWELAVIDEIIKKSTFEEIPDILIESELHKMLHELEHEVSHQGMKFEDYLSSIKKSKEDLHKEFEPQAVKRVKTALILRSIAEAENITVNNMEVKAELDKHKERFKNNSEVFKQINTEEYKDYLRNVMKGRKVFEYFNKDNKGH